MSTALKPKLDAAKSTERAAKNLAVSDTKRLINALLIVSGEQVERNEQFAARVRVIYDALPETTSRTKKAKPSIADFTPVKHVPGLTYDPAKPPDPYLLYEAYGTAQFPQLLDFLSLARLKEVAAVVEQRNPGTKPVSRSKKDSVIDYIVHHVTQS